MGGDDSFLPGKIAKQVEWLEADNNRTLCYHDIDVYDSDTGKTLYFWSEKYRFRNGNARTIIKHGVFFGATSVMIRYPNSIFFNEQIPTASDWFMCVEVLEKQSGYLGYVDGAFARYRRHKKNITLMSTHRLHDALATISAVESLVPSKYDWECKQKKAEIYFIEAYKNLSVGEFLAAYYAFIQSFRVCHGLWLAPVRLLLLKIFQCRL